MRFWPSSSLAGTAPQTRPLLLPGPAFSGGTPSSSLGAAAFLLTLRNPIAPDAFPCDHRIRGRSMFRKGTKVEWNWSGSTATGKITEIFTDDVERTIKGSKIKRKASKDEPAYMIEQEDGDRVLKSKSELKRAD